MAAKSMVKGLALLAASQVVDAHSWVEAIYKIGNSGSFVGEPGYAMGWYPRNTTGWNDTNVEYQILDRTLDPPVCKQFFQGQNPNNTKLLSAAAGESLALQYIENGHVTTPQIPVGKPYRGGNVYVYGTLKHKVDDKLNDILNVWNTDGTGGNKNGKLLATHYFDDGQCYENRQADHPDAPIYVERKQKYGLDALSCQTDIQLPEDIGSSGTYTLMWVWDWPTNNGQTGNTTEIYTSCAEIELAPKNNSAPNGVKIAADLPVTIAAIASQLESPVEALTLGVGTNSPPAPSSLPTQTGAASNATVTAKPTSAHSHKGGVETVTVTAEAETITEYKTVTVGFGAKPQGSTSTFSQATVTATMTASPSVTLSSPAGDAAVISVTPFMLKPRATGQARRVAAGLA